MTVTLSTELMRAMGFHPIEMGESVTAAFTSVCVYEARGIALQAGTTEIISGAIAGVNYRIATGKGLNETCVALANDVYVEGEDDWKQEKGCSGPFVLIQLGPTQQYTITTGQIRTEEDESKTTFESFPDLRNELAALEAAALPQLVTALTCLLGGPDRHLELRKIDRTSAGRTDTGAVIHDIYFHFSGTAIVSQGLAATQLAAGLHAAAALAPQLNAKAAQFFALGLGEDDELKRFLYFFLALEVQTHAVFGRVDNATALQNMIDPTLPPRPSAVALLHRQVDQLRNLFDRFVWCAVCAWSHIDDTDVEQFKKLKTARDNIAHGSISEPPSGYGNLAQQLAKKVLRA
jgi:hypothetical protein